MNFFLSLTNALIRQQYFHPGDRLEKGRERERNAHLHFLRLYAVRMLRYLQKEKSLSLTLAP